MRYKIKDLVTDLLGALIMGLTVWAVYTTKMEWVWEGLVGIGVGAVFFLLPDKYIAQSLKKYLSNKLNEKDS